MDVRKRAKNAPSRARKPQNPRQSPTHPPRTQPNYNTSKKRVPPVLPSPDPSHCEGDSPPNGEDPPFPSPVPHNDDPPASTNAGKIKWTSSELWVLALAVHDKQPYTAKHNDKAARWDEVRDIVNKERHHERSTKSYHLQMKRLLSWQRGGSKDLNKLSGAERDGYKAMEKILQKDQVTSSKLGAILDKILTAKEELGKADDEKKDKAAKKRTHDEEIGAEIRHRSMVVGRYLPKSVQDADSPRPGTVPLPGHTPTPPVGSELTPDQISDSPGTPIPWSRSNTPPPHPSVTPHHGQLQDIQNTPSPGPSGHKDQRRCEDGDDLSEDDFPMRKRRKTRIRQKEDPISLLTAAIERNTEVVEQRHRESQELLERSTRARQKMFNDLMGALQDH